MTHKIQRKGTMKNHQDIKKTKRHKNLVAALAGAAVLSGMVLPAGAEAAVPTPVAQVEQGNIPSSYEQVINVKATAYAPGYQDNGPWGNKTHIGTQVRPGIIAVDPSIIPLGSRVYIQFPDGHGVFATAEDTGGAIKGNRIDVAKSDRQEAKDFGIQNVKVYVVSTPDVQKK